MKAAITIIATAALAGAAHGAPARQGGHGDWEIYRDTEAGVCFALTRPVDAAPRSYAHGPVYFMLARFPGRAAQASFHAGYELEPSRAPALEIASDDFESYAAGSEAYVNDADEPDLIEAMRQGADMRVQAQSRDGAVTAYEFSLSGVIASLRDLDRLC